MLANIPFLELVGSRRSCRSFAPDQPVPDELLERCLEAARLAPSACNRQPWRFVVVRQPATLEAIFQRCRLPGLAHTWWRQAPVMVALCVDLDWLTHRLAPAISGLPYYLIDAGIAGEHFVLAASEAGLGSCWIGWFHQRRLKKLLGLPRRVRIASLLAVGYPAASPDQSQPAPRLPLPTIARREDWQHPW